ASGAARLLQFHRKLYLLWRSAPRPRHLALEPRDFVGQVHLTLPAESGRERWLRRHPSGVQSRASALLVLSHHPINGGLCDHLLTGKGTRFAIGVEAPVRVRVASSNLGHAVAEILVLCNFRMLRVEPLAE